MAEEQTHRKPLSYKDQESDRHMIQEYWVGYGWQEALPGVGFAGGGDAARSWSLGPLFPQSLNVVWGGSLGTSSRKTWESLGGQC